MRAIVIGSGFGGLACAIRLQAAGFEVTIIEAREKLGGRAYQLKDGGYTFDMGPSLITAPHLLEDLWSAAGRTFEDNVPLVPLSPYYRIYFSDGTHFDYGGESDDAEIAKFNPDDVEGYRAFLGHTEHIYQRAFEDLAGQSFHRFGDFASIVPELLRLRAQRSVYATVQDYIQDPRLQMVFSFHPLFIGGNPLRASAIYSIVPYLERQGGVHFTSGGMYTLVTAMEVLFRSLGGEVVVNSPVARILVDGDATRGVETSSGVRYEADIVVANSDVATTYLELLPSSARPRLQSEMLRRYRYSMSCFLLYLGLDRQYDELLHHTIYMPRDYPKLLNQIFDGEGMPDDLALYLHAPTRTDPSMAPMGGESLYILAPVPHLGKNINWHTEADDFRNRIIRFLQDDAGLAGLEESIQVEHRFTPLDFRDQLGSWLGSAFSIEPTLTQSAYFRPHNRSPAASGLYFVGAGTHPGAGLPGVLLSAKITSDLVQEDFEAALA